MSDLKKSAYLTIKLFAFVIVAFFVILSLGLITDLIRERNIKEATYMEEFRQHLILLSELEPNDK